MTTFDEYAKKYADIRMERRDGILEVTFHTDGGSLKWTPRIHREAAYAFTDIGADRENKVVIITGTGKSFLTEMAWPPTESSAANWDLIYWEGKRLIMNLLDIEAPVIGVLNGPTNVHGELILLSDIVIAADDAWMSDAAHFKNGGVPGDGVHVMWPLLLGPNRGRYFLLTGEQIQPSEAKSLGIVQEVMPREKLLPRAWQLAEEMVKKNPLTLRYARACVVQPLKRAFLDNLGYGLALEGLASLNRPSR